eukprot:3900274-Lingulodinium_polyedra.AAC.1
MYSTAIPARARGSSPQPAAPVPCLGLSDWRRTRRSPPRGAGRAAVGPCCSVCYSPAATC